MNFLPRERMGICETHLSIRKDLSTKTPLVASNIGELVAVGELPVSEFPI